MTTKITRMDRYSISVNGHRIRATEEQERKLREMTPEQVENFLKVMGSSQ